jgi:predicted dinucleotide-binding enzyme
MPTTPIQVAVIGTGNIGGTVGRALARAGYGVTFGARRPTESADAAGDTAAKVADIPSALASSDVILLAVPAGAVDAFISENGDAIRDKLIIDATNRVGGDGSANAHAALSQVTSHYARAFNTLGWENFENPRFGDVEADLFYSATEADRQTMDTLIAAVGLRPQYLGDGQQEVVDGLLRVWFALVFGQKHDRRLALRVLD